MIKIWGNGDLFGFFVTTSKEIRSICDETPNTADGVQGMLRTYLSYYFISNMNIYTANSSLAPWVFLKDLFPALEKKGFKVADLKFFDTINRDDVLRFYGDKWAVYHNCPLNLEDIADEMKTKIEVLGRSVNLLEYQMEDMKVFEIDVLMHLNKMMKTMNAQYYSTF
jgi:hypothetical protein